MPLLPSFAISLFNGRIPATGAPKTFSTCIRSSSGSVPGGTLLRMICKSFTSSRHGGPLEVLIVGPHDQQEDIRERNREQGFLVDSGVGIDEEDIEVEGAGQRAKAIGQEADVIALSQDACDLPGLDARGDQEECP